MYLTPPVTALLAWLLFGEVIGVQAWAGVLVTMSGVALVLNKRIQEKPR
jgi:drug/metabolite transporter (DMT)-like permease